MKRVGIIFSGGPAPGANAVINSAVTALRREGCEVIGFKHGYSALIDRPDGEPLKEGEHYLQFENSHLRGLRNRRGIILGTARANPGKAIKTAAHLDDPERTRLLQRVYEDLCALELDGLVSIGGEDTLRTANLLHLYQERLPEGAHRVRVVHLPKTIDNDYLGIDFTFGFFTAVDVLAKELLNLRADAVATRRYYIVECMGRKAAWLPYGVAIAGEAHMVVGVEDVKGKIAIVTDGRNCLDLDALCDQIVELIVTREEGGRHYGTVVLAEGLAELLPDTFHEGLVRDPHGHLSISKLHLGKLVAQMVAAKHASRTGRSCSVTGVQLGYESRCAAPHAFDVVLGCQLGRGAARALVELQLDAHMVSVAGQMDLRFVPFSDLIDSQTLMSSVRFVEPGSDFHRLAHELGTRVPFP